MWKIVHRFSDNKKLSMSKAKPGSVEPWGADLLNAQVQLC